MAEFANKKTVIVCRNETPQREPLKRYDFQFSVTPEQFSTRVQKDVNYGIEVQARFLNTVTHVSPLAKGGLLWSIVGLFPYDPATFQPLISARAATIEIFLPAYSGTLEDYLKLLKEVTSDSRPPLKIPVFEDIRLDYKGDIVFTFHPFVTELHSNGGYNVTDVLGVPKKQTVLSGVPKRLTTTPNWLVADGIKVHIPELQSYLSENKSWISTPEVSSQRTSTSLVTTEFADGFRTVITRKGGLFEYQNLSLQLNTITASIRTTNYTDLREMSAGVEVTNLNTTSDLVYMSSARCLCQS